MYFRAIFKVNVQNEDIFGGCKNSKIFGCLIFLIFLGVDSRCCMRKKIRVPLGHTHPMSFTQMALFYLDFG